MTLRKLVSFAAAAALAIGLVALAAPTPAEARPRARCTIEEGDPACPPCTTWSAHLCRCVKIPACKL